MKEYNLERLQKDYETITKLKNKRDAYLQGWTKEEELEYLDCYIDFLTFEKEPSERDDISNYEDDEIGFLKKRKTLIENIGLGEAEYIESAEKIFLLNPLSYIKHSIMQDYIKSEDKTNKFYDFIVKTGTSGSAKEFNCWDSAIHIILKSDIEETENSNFKLKEIDKNKLYDEYIKREGNFSGRPKYYY